MGQTKDIKLINIKTKLSVVCSWCGKDMATDGMCPACLAEWEQEIKGRKNIRKSKFKKVIEKEMP